MTWIRSHKAAVASIGVVGLAAVAWLAFGVFGVQTLFVDDKVSDAAPTFDSGATLPANELPASPTTVDSGPTSSTTTTVVDASATPSTGPTVSSIADGTFVGRGHPSSGRAVVLSDGAQTFLRFEAFETSNGPDLFVYLSRGVTADGPEATFDDDFVSLGSLKGNIGEQNYAVPSDVDVSAYPTVVIWCRTFSVAFAAADLA